MLVLSRKIDEELVLTGGIRIRVLEIRGARVRLGIAAPREVDVCRGELIGGANQTVQEPIQNVALQTATAEARVKRTLTRSRRRAMAAG